MATGSFLWHRTVLERFPGARFVARPDVIKVMRQQASPGSLGTFWNRAFPARFQPILQLPKNWRNLIRLEGHDLVSVHSDLPNC